MTTETLIEYPTGTCSFEMWIAEDRVSALEGKIEEIAKAARRTKSFVPTLTITEEKRARFVRRLAGTSFVPGVQLLFVRRSEEGTVWQVVEVLARITFCVPRLAGDWELLATVDQDPRLPAPIINTRPDITLPDEEDRRVRSAGPICEHCKTIRRRKDTLLIRNDAGKSMLVGKSCVADYLGTLSHSAQSIMRLAGLLRELKEQRDFEGEGRDFAERFIPIEAIVGASMMATSDPRKDKEQVRGVVGNILFNRSPLGDMARTDLREWASVEENQALVRDAIEWATRDMETLTGYRANLAIVVKMGVVRVQDLNLATSLAMAYRREMGRIAQQRAADEFGGAPKHVGVIGERSTFEVMLVGEPRFFDSEFGGSFLHKFAVKGGGTLAWFGTKKLDAKVGEVIKIKATVKKHAEFRGVPDTQVSRVALA